MLNDEGCMRFLFCIMRTVRVTEVAFKTVRSFGNDDGDGSENVKKATGLIIKPTTLHVHYTFWYISLPSLHDYDVKFPDGTFYGGRN